MITLLFKAETVGPVCQRVAKISPEDFQVVHEGQSIPYEGVLVRWGSTKSTPYLNSKLIINSSEAVALAKDKIKSRQVLGDLAPKTWYRVEDIQLPCVIRPRVHHGGNRFLIPIDRSQVRRFTTILKRRGWYASELVNKVREYRVFVLHGRVVAMSQRFPANPSDVAWNLATGGRLINVRYKEWDIPVCKAAVGGAIRLGLDWAAMDVAVAQDGRVVVFEANTAPGLRNPYTLEKIAHAFIWSEDNPIPGPKPDAKTWKGLAHPSLRD